MANQDNLVPLTTEKAREIGKIGAAKSAKVRKKKKQVKELLQSLLSCAAPERDIKKIQQIFPAIDVKTIEDLLNLSMIKQGVKGNVQAYNAVYDRIEGKPQQKTDITTDGKSLNEYRNLTTDELLKLKNESNRSGTDSKGTSK